MKINWFLGRDRKRKEGEPFHDEIQAKLDAVIDNYIKGRRHAEIRILLDGDRAKEQKEALLRLIDTMDLGVALVVLSDFCFERAKSFRAIQQEECAQDYERAAKNIFIAGLEV